MENFQTQSTRPKDSPENAWVLVRSEEDGIHGPEMSQGIEPFINGFENADPETLQDFVLSNCAPDNSYPNFKGEISNEMFVVLDDRSAQDNTCLLYFLYEVPAELAGPEVGDEEGVEYYEDSELIWKIWRVKFLVAWMLSANLWFNPSLTFGLWAKGEKDYYIDERGVLQYADFEQTGEFDPPLMEVDKVPYGPVLGGVIAT